MNEVGTVNSSYEARVLKRQLEQCDYLGSRGPDGIKGLQKLAAAAEANDGGMGHRMVPLPEGWFRGVPLHGAVINAHVGTTLPFLVETLGARLDWRDKKTGNTAVHVAVIWGHVDVVAYLLARGAVPNAQNKEGLTPGPMARRRQALLESGTSEEKSFYTRGGIPIKALVKEGAALCGMLDGVGEDFTAWARAVLKERRANDFYPLICKVAPWLHAECQRFDLALLRLGSLNPPAKQKAPPKKVVITKAQLKKKVAAAAKAAREVARRSAVAADPTLEAALAATAGDEREILTSEEVARALRWLKATNLDEARGLSREEVGEVDGLEAKQRRTLWLFISKEQARLAKTLEQAAKVAELMVIQKETEDTGVECQEQPPMKEKPFLALCFRETLPEPLFQHIAKFAYGAKRPPALPEEPLHDDILAALSQMRI